MTTWLSLFAVVLLFSFSGCSNSESPTSPPLPNEPAPLAVIELGWGVGAWVDSLIHVQLDVGYVLNGQEGHLFAFYLDQHEVGEVISLTPQVSRGFDAFTGLFTNGKDEFVQARLRAVARSGGMTIGGGVWESDAVTGERSGVVADLADTTVSRIDVVFDKLDIASPGRDPNQDGMWMDVHVRVSVELY